MTTHHANEIVKRGYRALWEKPFEILPGQPGITLYRGERDEMLAFAEEHGLSYPIIARIEELSDAFKEFQASIERAALSMHRVYGVDWGYGKDYIVEVRR